MGRSGEPVVGARGFQPFLQGSIVGGELADALSERGVLKTGDDLFTQPGSR
jgi:hypothetical protein